MPRVSVDLSDELYRKFDEKCLRTHRKKVEVIRELLERWLKTE
jgi:metal-responsive CopG/Arc/MetJ family transcriptional regulator